MAFWKLGDPKPLCEALAAARASGDELFDADGEKHGAPFLVAGRWLLAAGCWLLAVGCWPLAAGCWLLIILEGPWLSPSACISADENAR